MYDTDPKIQLPVKTIDEQRQGEAVELKENRQPGSRLYYIESYGCQMNFNDSEIVASILSNAGFNHTTQFHEADLIMINTCSIRDNAEQRIRRRLQELNVIKKEKPGALVGILGCMAERLKASLLEQEKIVDLVVGPDAYRDLPRLVSDAEGGQKAVNVFLSKEETYAEINPVRLQSNGVSAFISIMRGCDNMCAFCVVPFTRGRERSRSPETILEEAIDLINRGFKEVTLLGQNVDSYNWKGENNQTVNFARLLELVANLDSKLRVRFSTSHPKDITDDVLHTIAKYENICNYIHLPVQSGSSRILGKMNRTYDREWYLGRVKAIRRIIPDCAISSDIITGFCSETEEDHQETLTIMEEVVYDMSYMFFYSERPGTLAERKFDDDIPLDIKKRRLSEVIALQQKLSLRRNQQDIGKVFEVLVEGHSKKSENDLAGRNSQNKMVIFPKKGNTVSAGDYVKVKVLDCTSATLLGVLVSC
jgi:tRNA-2-methylthio-N6-dimethylallyladenosine synthase